eukprot:1118341-Amphidinium_carterae.2
MEFSTLGGWIATRASGRLHRCMFTPGDIDADKDSVFMLPGMKRSRYGNIEERMQMPEQVWSGMAWQHNGLTSEGGQAAHCLVLA